MPEQTIITYKSTINNKKMELVDKKKYDMLLFYLKQTLHEQVDNNTATNLSFTISDRLNLNIVPNK